MARRRVLTLLVTSVAPIPMATMMGKEWGGMGQNYLRSLLALGFQAFLIIVCVAIYAVLVQNIATEEDIIMAIWSCVGYTVLLCFTLFKTGSLSKAVFNAYRPGRREFTNGLCTRTQRPDESQNQGRVQLNQEAACLLRLRGAHRRAAFLFAPGACWQQRSGHVHDARHAAFLHAGDV